jgi:hypothetical protein
MTNATNLTCNDPSPAVRTARVAIITTAPIPAIGEIPLQRRPAWAGESLRKLGIRLARLPVPTMSILALLAVGLALIGFRDPVARVLPRTAAIYAAVGLSAGPRGPMIEDVTTVMTRRGGMPTLTIQGKITSRAPQTVDLPRLNFAILDHRGNEIVTWSTLPNRDQLAAGATMEFTSHYAVPPGDAREVVVRLSSRNGASSGPK